MVSTVHYPYWLWDYRLIRSLIKKGLSLYFEFDPCKRLISYHFVVFSVLTFLLLLFQRLCLTSNFKVYLLFASWNPLLTYPSYFLEYISICFYLHCHWNRYIFKLYVFLGSYELLAYGLLSTSFSWKINHSVQCSKNHHHVLQTSGFATDFFSKIELFSYIRAKDHHYSFHLAWFHK